MEFNSAICTSVEQSKRLLELGLKKETADMCWQKLTLNGEVITYPAQDVWHCSTAITDYHIPAWSLGRLLELCGGIAYDWLFRSDNYFENMVSCIEWMISKECFNKEYLEEKK